MGKEDYTIYCSRCGAEMKSSSRYCMKCGNLNYDHPENKSMLNYVDKDQNGYTVGSGKSVLGRNNNQVINSVANNTGNKKFCFTVNVGIFVFLVLITLLICLASCSFDFIKLMGTIFPILLVIYSLMFIFVYSTELIFIKMNKRWWTALVPVYRFIVLSEVIFKNKNLGFLVLVPFVGSIYMFVLLYRLGQCFKFNGIITALCSIIVIPIIGFGNSLFDGRNFIDYEEKNSLESDYKNRKNALTVGVLFLFIGGAMLVYSNIATVEKGVSFVSNYYYINATNKMYKGTKAAIEKGKIDCDNMSDNTYYFYYHDVSDYFNLPLSFYFDPIEGYVKVVRSEKGDKYYLSITDGNNGYKETLYEKINSDTITSYEQIKDESDIYNSCDIK